MSLGAPAAESPSGMRLARALATLGVASRRRCEALIRAGRIAVNGVLVDDVATNVTLNQDAIALDGKLLAWPRGRRYYAVHKPRGFVSTVRDPHASRTVIQLIPSQARLYPVGRLDKDSEGLILLTDDGDFTNRVTHPRYQVEKEYQALVFPTPSDEALAIIRGGVELDGKLARPESVSVDTRTGGVWVTVVLMEGRKHEVRRILGSAGLSVRRLVRTRIGRVELGDLGPGQYRELHPHEVAEFLGGALPQKLGGRRLNSLSLARERVGERGLSYQPGVTAERVGSAGGTSK